MCAKPGVYRDPGRHDSPVADTGTGLFFFVKEGMKRSTF